MKASECKCCICGKQAVAFWPVIDPDIPADPYCRKCLDEAKHKLMMKILGRNQKQKLIEKLEEELKRLKGE